MAHDTRSVCEPSGLPARIEAVHVLAIHRIQVRNLLRERWHVDQRYDDQRSRKLRRIGSLSQFLEREDGRVLGAVRSGHEGEHWPCFGAVDHDHRDARGRIHASRDDDIAGGLLPAARGRGANREIGGPDQKRQQRSH
jgi:hypothetical protein